MAKPTTADVFRFLTEFKTVAEEKGIDFIPRAEFIEALASLGFTKRNCKDEIFGLSVENYCNGPEEDRDRPGHVWVFGKLIEGKEIYIKLKIAKVGERTIAKCLSFHPAEFPLCFPMTEKGGSKK